MSRILENSALCNRVCHLILKEEQKHTQALERGTANNGKHQNTFKRSSSKGDGMRTHLSNDDFFTKDFHCVVHPRGLLLDQDYFAKCSFAQQLQVVKVAHSLQKTTNQRYCFDIHP